MSELFVRLAAMLGEEAMTRLSRAHIAVFGLGGVGGACAEALARSGVGKLTLVDSDSVSESNRNRQAIAFSSTVGMAKTDAASALLREINPAIGLCTRQVFFNAETADTFDFSEYDYVVDCIDTVTAKLLLIERCRAVGTPIVCCMGTGNKLDPSRLRLSDLEKTDTCPLARVMRIECRKRGIRRLPVVWSDEIPAKAVVSDPASDPKRNIPGSSAFVPPAAGLLLASAVVRAVALGETLP